MKILVVGGSGSLGGHAATYLSKQGHEVSIGARKRPPEGTPMAKMPLVQGDYLNGDFTPERLKGFDALVFAAGFAVRDVPVDNLPEQYRAAVERQPRLARAAREAGVKRMVQLGSFYAQAAPELAANNLYMRSRQLACEAARAEGRPGFDVIGIDPPVMVGGVPGLPSQLTDPQVAWAKGELDGPLFAAAGSTNFMSYRSLSQAIEGALLRGEPGKAYLVGDENLSYADYLSLLFKAVGKPIQLESRAEVHPLFPWLGTGDGSVIRYEPDPQETALLGYARNDVTNGVAEAVAEYEARHQTKPA